MKFWLLQALGWSLFLLIQLLFRVEEGQPWLGDAVVFASSLTVLAVLLSLALRQFYRWLSRQTYGALRWFASCMMMSVLAAALVDIAHTMLLQTVALFSPSWAPLADEQPLGSRFTFVLPAYWVWSLLYLALSRQERWLRVERQQQQLQLALREAQLHSLLAQLNPHFMFNTLNNIRALILKDGEAARTMLANFADVLRYQLDTADSALVSVAEEMQVVHDYLALVRLQLGKRLSYVEDIAVESLPWRIPRLAIQLLVENAVKHGLSQSPAVGILRIDITASATLLTIHVRNSGQLTSATHHGGVKNGGVGIANLRQRLALAFEHRSHFHLKQEGELVQATITVEKAT